MGKRIASPLIRAALIVPDADLAANFYQQVFGFEQVYYEGSLNTPAAARVIGAPKGTVLKCKIIRGEGPNFDMVGFFEMVPDNSTPLTHAGGVKTGEVVLVFYCADVASVMANVIRLGATPICLPTPFDMPHETQLEASFCDPNGVFVNIVERDPERAFDDTPVKTKD
jgi:catechol 2,3-dioxygenase-like lactoylglutathione lyase family enzyme